MNIGAMKHLVTTTIACLLCATAAHGQTAPKMKMTADIPVEITTPDSVETRLGTLKLFDSFPDDATTQKVYDNFDFQRGVQAFLNAMPGAALTAFRPAFRKFGAVDGNVLIFEELMDSKALWLTANTTVVYYASWIDTKEVRSCSKPRPILSVSWTTTGFTTSAISETPARTRARAASS